ncbi:MAG: cobalt-precorrin-5B (C(1))-methyltransferase [Methanomicrobiales archaeon]|nr:cobalt-precorrin-5B (C(1))-methyltransferase [Methanomicrobiales archaeon]
MVDPVTGFIYPEQWVIRCTAPSRLREVVSGLSILTSDGTLLRRGFTTGASAAAACKASLLSLKKEIGEVDILIPCGLRVQIPVKGEQGEGRCIKFGGDHPSDVTAGLEFVASARSVGEGGAFVPGEGIGTFIRNTPRYRSGEPSISPTAMSCIRNAIEEAIHETCIFDARVELIVPRGREVAAHTLNARIGVEGGISLLGTTGFVEPWDDHLTESLIERVRDTNKVVLTTGRTGLRYSCLLFPDYTVILAGGKFLEVLTTARGKVILCGLPGLILRSLDPAFLEGSPFRTIEEMTSSPDFIRRAYATIARFQENHPGVRVVLIDREGTVVVDSP